MSALNGGHAMEAMLAITAALGTITYPATPEKIVQAIAANHLRSKGFVLEREVTIGPGMIVDILVTAEGNVLIGVEFKIGGAATAIARQLHGYASSGALAGLIVASTSRRVAHELARSTGTLSDIPFAVKLLPTRLG